MSENQVIFRYEGPIDATITDSLLEKVKNELASHNIRKVYKKRVYNIMVESIENILRYNPINDGGKPHPYVQLEKEGYNYRLISANPVKNGKIGQLRTRLNKIANSNKEQLEKMYEEQINVETDYSKIGAGLGFLIMALKSAAPLQYNFIEFNDELSIFELCTTVTIDNI